MPCRLFTSTPSSIIRAFGIGLSTCLSHRTVRSASSSPFSKIGDDNIIHGAQWIAGLPSENFTVQLAYASNKDALYEIAQSYNYYLKDALSYFKVDDKGAVKYVLLSGNYSTQKQAMVAINSMPRYVDMQQPMVRKVDVIQKHISQ